MIKVTGFFAVVFTALALVPSGAHLLELSSKLQLGADEYLTVQRLYQGWALAGIVVVGALVSDGLLFIRLRGRAGFVAAIVGFACILATQLVFWSFTYPVNATTQNWTVLPVNWQSLRLRWELSHASSAILNLLALFAVTTAIVRARSKDSSPVAHGRA